MAAAHQGGALQGQNHYPQVVNDAALTGRSFYCGSYTQGVALG